jgi:hypothetical protein
VLAVIHAPHAHEHHRCAGQEEKQWCKGCGGEPVSTQRESRHRSGEGHTDNDTSVLAGPMARRIADGLNWDETVCRFHELPLFEGTFSPVGASAGSHDEYAGFPLAVTFVVR